MRNFSYPFSLRFIGEIFLLGALLNWEGILLLYLILVCFINSAYSLYLYAFIQHGGFIYLEEKFYLRMSKEFLILLLHIFPLVLVLFNLVIFR